MKNQKQTIKKIVGFLNNVDEDGGFWLPNIQRPFYGERIKSADYLTPFYGSTQSARFWFGKP